MLFYLVLLSILNWNLENTYQVYVTKPVKKYMFCPELQTKCRWINGDFSSKHLLNLSLCIWPLRCFIETLAIGIYKHIYGVFPAEFLKQ